MFCPPMFRALNINTMFYHITGNIVYHVAKYLILLLAFKKNKFPVSQYPCAFVPVNFKAFQQFS